MGSIFVNPLQFAPSEDLERYPRDLPGDTANLESAGADLLFTVTSPDSGGLPVLDILDVSAGIAAGVE